jgi:hypothetical protein
MSDHLRAEHIRLKQMTQRNLMQLIDSEFTLAHTMADLAETEAELRNPEHARVLVGKIKHAILSARERLEDTELAQKKKDEVLRQLVELEKRTDSLMAVVNCACGSRELAAS